MRIWAISDVHTDYEENREWLENLSTTEYQEDAIIVAGDISDRLTVISQSLQQFSERWKHVFFCWGNHELWVRDEKDDIDDSIAKAKALLDLCGELGVHCKPKQLAGVWIVPLTSWYHASFDQEPDVPGASDITKVMTDFHACKWPADVPQEEAAGYMDALNDNPLAEVSQQQQENKLPVISFSHFLPFQHVCMYHWWRWGKQELLPEKRMLFQPNLAKAAGSTFLQARIAQLKPVAHIFGHTHFPWDATLDGVRYCQWPLGYPRERKKRQNGANWQPLLVYDTETGMSDPQSAYWSDYYKLSEREPSNVEPAPWVQL